MNPFRYIGTAVKVYKEIQVQKRYNKTFLLPYLNELELKFNGKFQPEQKKKIVDYYGLFITSFLCSSYVRLYGRTLTGAERKRATLFGILTPVGDDLFDIDKLPNHEIEQITFQPESYDAKTFSAKVAKEIQTFLLNDVPFKKEYINASKDVLNIQVETAKQTNSSISFEEMQRITWIKGAVSVIIYHQCLDTIADAQMLDVLFMIGSLYQLGNDIFDLYKDVRDNIYTTVNTCNDFEVFEKRFIARVKEQNEKIYALPYTQKDKESFCIVMNAINARSMVAIQQLKKTEKRLGKDINWWQQPRKAMITDMEKPLNLLKWMYYIFLLPTWRSKR